MPSQVRRRPLTRAAAPASSQGRSWTCSLARESGAGCAAMTRENRLRDRLMNRFRCLHQVRLRFPAGSAQSPVSACTLGGFRGAPLCDISTPGCSSLRSSQASSELCAALAGRAVASQLSASPSELAAPRPRGLLALLPVPSLAACLRVAHRVVAGRRSPRVGWRRSALCVLPGAVAGSVAHWRRPAQPTGSDPAAVRDWRTADPAARRALVCGWGEGLR
jgi:hypothetical protein